MTDRLLEYIDVDEEWISVIVYSTIGDGNYELADYYIDKYSSLYNEEEIIKNLGVYTSNNNYEACKYILDNYPHNNLIEYLNNATSGYRDDMLMLYLGYDVCLEYQGEDSEYRTILKQPIQNGDFEMVKLLVENGAPVNTAAMICASRNYSRNILLYLLDNDGDINAVDEDGFTPLTSAVEAGIPEITRILIENNDDEQELAKQMEEAMIIAEQNDYFDIKKILKEYE